VKRILTSAAVQESPEMAHRDISLLRSNHVALVALARRMHAGLAIERQAIAISRKKSREFVIRINAAIQFFCLPFILDRLSSATDIKAWGRAN
jgi:hypothetical protein